MRVSIAVKGDIISIYSDDLGIKRVEKIRDKELVGKRFYGVMYAVRRTVSLLRSKLEDLRTDDIITFEVSNGILVKWILEEASNRDYEEYFTEMMNELNMLPMRYTFNCIDNVKASMYLDESNIEKVSLGSLEDML